LANIEELKKYKNIHMIGIGGISMSGIAEILKFWGFHVTGSDSTASETTERLIQNGISVVIGHDLENLAKADVVVYSAAIKKDDIELLKAKELNIPIIERGTFLGKITKAFNNSICVSGTHGKTTTTSMISVCFLEAHKDPSIQVGAYLKQLKGNYRVGNSEYFIIEACEYVESYLKLFPRTEIILNIDNDHLDYFGNLDNIVKSFDNYIKLLPEDGLLVINSDDANCRRIAKDSKAKIVTFALDSENANFIARNIKFNKDGFPCFDVYYNNNKKSGAYSSGTYDTLPYVLLNYEGKFNDVSTIAHEIGHSMHSYYSNTNNTFEDSSYPIFLAEIASTVNEVLLNKYMYEHSDKKDEKLFFLNNLLETIRTTLYRQTMFAEFEKITHEKEKNNEVLTSEVLNDIYYDLNKKYFSNAYVDENIKYEWARIPHFYTSFYVYKYATGISVALSIVSDILNNKPNALDNYLLFLKSGGSNYPLEILKKCGIDIVNDDTIEKALQVFNDTLEDFIRSRK